MIGVLEPGLCNLLSSSWKVQAHQGHRFKREKDDEISMNQVVNMILQ